MKRLLAILFLVLSISPAAFSDTKLLGIGVYLGEPTGVTAAFNADQSNTIDILFAWSFQNTGSFYLHGDYQYRFPTFFNIEEVTFGAFFGLGGKILFNNDITAGLRFPLGIYHSFKTVPIELFFEIAPQFELYPATDFTMGGGIGFYYFF
jgi:hypothetical protein